MYTCTKWYMFQLTVGGPGSIPTKPANSQLKHTSTDCCIYTLLPPDGKQLASPKHVEV
jgi:hypothetical protein